MKHESCTGHAMTLGDIAKRFGIGHQAVSNTEQRALRKLRSAIRRAAQAENKTVREWLFDE